MQVFLHGLIDPIITANRIQMPHFIENTSRGDSVSVPVGVLEHNFVLFSEWLGASHRRLSVSFALPVPLDLACSSMRFAFFPRRKI